MDLDQFSPSKIIENVEAIERDDRQVSMSNKLARATHSLNLPEKRLVALGLAATDSVSEHELALASKNGWTMRVRAIDYAEAFGVDASTAYDQIKQGAEHLFDRYVRYVETGKRGKPEEVLFRWVSGARHAQGEGFVELTFTHQIAPHLLGLRSQFTTYKLRSAASFDSIYAWRLFEVLKSWQSTGQYTVEIEDFWDVMDAPASCRKDFGALRARVITPSVAAIQSKANL
jgi:plasmid replication initiation protein